MTATFPQAPLGAKVELDLAGTWTDVTSYALQRDGTSPPIAITRGRPDESAQVNPSAATLQLNNRDGRFSVLNATGPYYGQIGRNTPVRISVPAQNTYLRMETDNVSYISCPDAAGLDITGDMEIQMDLHLSDYSPCLLASKYISVAGGVSWALAVDAGGFLQLQTYDGTAYHLDDSTIPLPVGHLSIRVTFQANNGSGGHSITFYTGPAGAIGAGPWTQLGQVVTASGTAGIHTTTAPVVVGYVAGWLSDELYYNSIDSAGCVGSVFGFQLLNGIAGTVKAYANFAAQTAGVTSFTDAQSNVWTLSGTAELSNRSYRFHGEMSSLPVTWDTSGTDVWVPVAAGGLLRRAGQGNAPLDSSLKRAILSQTGTLAPVAYWPCEDLAGSTQIGSAIGGPAMTISGGTGNGSTTTTGPSFAADSSFLCSLALPQVNGSEWIGQVPAYTSNGALIVRFLMNIQAEPPNNARIIRVVTTGTCTEVAVYYGTGGALGLAGYNASGTVFDTGTYSFGTADKETFWMSIELTSGGGSTVNVALEAVSPGGSEGGTGSHSFTGIIGNAASVIVDPYQDMTSVTIGHISVQSAYASVYTLAAPNVANPLNAWQGEAAAVRFARLCGENGFTSRVYGVPVTTVPMGAQAPSTLTTLLQEIEEADHGQLFEPRRSLAIGYRPVAAITSQSPAVTIDYSQAELAGADLMPTYDDQFTRNDITVQRSGGGSVSGSSYRYELADGSAMSVGAPPAGVGDYSDSKSVNAASDTQLPDQAGWLVHIGTVNEARWPMLPLDMARPAVSGIFYTILGADIGDFAEVVSPPAWLPPDPVKQIILGTKEDLGGFHYKIVWQAIPESVYEVAVFDDLVYGRADTDGSTLHANFSAGATSITVDTTNAASPLWSTAGADVPFDIAVAGERMTVTAVSGSSSPQTFTVTRAVNGVSKAQTSGADVRLWFPPILALI